MSWENCKNNLNLCRYEDFVNSRCVVNWYNFDRPIIIIKNFIREPESHGKLQIEIIGIKWLVKGEVTKSGVTLEHVC